MFEAIKSAGFDDQNYAAEMAFRKHQHKKETRRMKRKASFAYGARHKAQYNHWSSKPDESIPVRRSSFRKNAYKGSLHGFTLARSAENQMKYKGSNTVCRPHADMCRLESAKEKLEEAMLVSESLQTNAYDRDESSCYFGWYEGLKSQLMHYEPSLTKDEIDSLGMREILYLADQLGFDKNVDVSLFMEPVYFYDDFGCIHREMAPIRLGEVATKILSSSVEDSYGWEDMDYLYDKEEEYV